MVVDGGFGVAGGDRGDGSAAVRAADAVAAAGGNAVACVEDIATTAGAERAVALALSRYGRVDGLVCCAGNFRQAPLTEMCDDDWDEVVRVHLRGHFAPVRAVARAIRQQGTGGSLVLCSSVAAVIGPAEQPAYSTAKAGILGLLVSASRSLAGDNIRVNAILPGASTRMTDALWSGSGGSDFNGLAVRSEMAAGTWRAPANLAPFVALLLSDESRTLSGQAYAVVGYQVSQVRLPCWGKTIRSDGPWDFDVLAARVRAELEPLPLPKLDSWPPA